MDFFMKETFNRGVSEARRRENSHPHSAPMASQARHESVSREETFAARIVVPSECFRTGHQGSGWSGFFGPAKPAGARGVHRLHIRRGAAAGRRVHLEKGGTCGNLRQIKVDLRQLAT